MSTIYELTEKIEQTRAAIPVLQSAASYANSISKEVYSSYNSLNSILEVNGDSIAPAKSLRAIADDMSETSNYINKTIIPSCNEKIRAYTNEIYRLQEEERRKQEEYARQQEEYARQQEEAKKSQESQKSKDSKIGGTFTSGSTTSTKSLGTGSSKSSKSSGSSLFKMKKF